MRAMSKLNNESDYVFDFQRQKTSFSVGERITLNRQSSEDNFR